MKAALKKKIITEMDDIPDSKANNLLNYIRFLKYEDEFKIPNALTEKTFKETDKGGNIKTHSSLDEYFNEIQLS